MYVSWKYICLQVLESHLRLLQNVAKVVEDDWVQMKLNGIWINHIYTKSFSYGYCNNVRFKRATGGLTDFMWNDKLVFESQYLHFLAKMVLIN